MPATALKKTDGQIATEGLVNVAQTLAAGRAGGGMEDIFGNIPPPPPGPPPAELDPFIGLFGNVPPAQQNADAVAAAQGDAVGEEVNDALAEAIMQDPELARELRVKGLSASALRRFDRIKQIKEDFNFVSVPAIQASDAGQLGADWAATVVSSAYAPRSYIGLRNLVNNVLTGKPRQAAMRMLGLMRSSLIKGITDQVNASKFARGNDTIVPTMPQQFRRTAESWNTTGMTPADGKYGRITQTSSSYVPRGAFTDRYGETVGTATWDQIENRARDGFSGYGAYTTNDIYGEGTGGFQGRGGLLSGLFERFTGIPTGNIDDKILQTVAPMVKQFVPGYVQQFVDPIVEANRTFSGSGRYRGRGRYEDGVEVADDSIGSPAAQLARIEKTGIVPNGASFLPGNGPKVAFNSLVNPGGPFTKTNLRVQTTNDETDTITFSHNEYLQDIQATTTNFTTILTLPINPGLSETFPLASKFAQYYEEYEMVQMIVKFRSVLTEGNTSAAGTVMIATSYNPSSAAFSDKRSVENSGSSASGKVTDVIIAGIECDPRKNAMGATLYTRYSALPPGADAQSYDMGFIQICTQGAPVGLVLGEIWIEYTLRLRKLRSVSQIPLAIQEGLAMSAIAQTALSTPTWAEPLNIVGNIFLSRGIVSQGPGVYPLFPMGEWESAPGNSSNYISPSPYLLQKDGVTAVGSQWGFLNYNASPNLGLVEMNVGNSIYSWVVQWEAVTGGQYQFDFSCTFETAYAGAAAQLIAGYKIGQINFTPQTNVAKIVSMSSGNANAGTLDIRIQRASTTGNYTATGSVIFGVSGQRGGQARIQISGTNTLWIFQNDPNYFGAVNRLTATSTSLIRTQ